MSSTPEDHELQAPTEIRWLGVSAAIASISVVGIAIGMGIPLLSVVLSSRGYSPTMIGFNTAVAGLASIAAAPLATPIAIRFGVARTIVVLILVGALAFLGFYFASDFWMWFPLRILLHIALTVVFILSEFWITTSAPPEKRGLILGIYATVLSLGFALGPWLFSRIGSEGLAPFGVIFALVAVAALPVLAALRESPVIRPGAGHGGFLRYVWLVPTATAAVLVFGAVETGGFALFPVYGEQIGYSESDAALLLTMIGLGNVLLQIPFGLLSDHVSDRRSILLGCACAGLLGMALLPLVSASWVLTAAVLFFWGGVVAALYTVGLAHLGSRLAGRDLASANAAFVFCYGIGMVLGPQSIGIGMDAFGAPGFALTLGIFFVAYIGLVLGRMIGRGPRT